MNAIVFGCGKLFVRFMVYKEKYLHNLKVLYVCDNDKSLQETTIFNLPIVSPEKLPVIENACDIILIVAGNDFSKEIAAQLHRAGIRRRVYRINEVKLDMALNESHDIHSGGTNGPEQDHFHSIFEEDKPTIPYIECDVTAHCNLNCKGCGRASNLMPEAFLSLDIFRRDFTRLSELYENIARIQLLGGEPLLHPDIFLFIEEAHCIFPKAEIGITTNGLLIPGASEKLFKVMREHNAGFSISLYPPTFHNWLNIKKVLNDEGIRYHLSEPIVFFSRVFTEEHRNPTEVMERCDLKCTIIRNGKISKCAFSEYFRRLRGKFNTFKLDNYNGGEIDIFDENINGWEINRRIQQPFELCGYCKGGHGHAFHLDALHDEDMRIPWECGGTPKIEDYIIGEHRY